MVANLVNLDKVTAFETIAFRFSDHTVKEHDWLPDLLNRRYAVRMPSTEFDKLFADPAAKGELKDNALEIAIEWYHQYIVTQAGKGGVARSRNTHKDNIKKATKDAPTVFRLKTGDFEKIENTEDLAYEFDQHSDPSNINTFDKQFGRNGRYLVLYKD